MVQAADFRDLNDISRFQCLNWPWVRSVLVQGQMSPGIEIVPEVSLQRPSQMPLTEHNHVIDALSANASNDPFREWILPGTSCCRQHLLNAHSLNPISELATVDSVTVSYEISRRRVFWERFDDLLCRPFCRGMLGDIEMQHAATLMRQHNEYKQNSQLQCGNGEEVDGNQLTDVVTQKSLPGLGWLFASLRHQTGDRSLRDFQAEFEKFPMDSRCAPEWIGSDHSCDQLVNFRAHCRTS